MEQPLALRESLAREVSVERIATLDEAHHRALDAAMRGAAVALIRNTVDEAIASYEALSAQFSDVMLFHARFAMCDRQKIESEVLSRFGKDKNDRRNAILVATQVIEQSLDLDFDLMISDLAPIDLLIQRAGRLWRHVRARAERPIAGPHMCILSPEPADDAGAHWPAPLLPKTGYVYKNRAVLWRSAKAMFAAGKIVSRTSLECAPLASGEIRTLVEAAYAEDALAIPPSLEQAEIKAKGDASAERTIAGHKLLKLADGYDWVDPKWERDNNIQTRLGEETITLRLARVEEGRIVPWAAVEGDDLRRAWALSEVSLRKSLCSGSNNAPEIQKLVEKAQRDWTLSEKEIPVVALSKPYQEEFWQGLASNSNKKPIRISYSALEGMKLLD